MGKTQVYEEICTEKREVDKRVLEQTVSLAVEIAREGREGRKIGTLFVVGDPGEVMKRSKPLILDPLHGHADESKQIEDPDMRETIKELAQLDGAFLVSNAGVVLSAARYIDAASESLDLPPDESRGRCRLGELDGQDVRRRRAGLRDRARALDDRRLHEPDGGPHLHPPRRRHNGNRPCRVRPTKY
jgi:hypothetical protein